MGIRVRKPMVERNTILEPMALTLTFILQDICCAQNLGFPFTGRVWGTSEVG